MAIISTPRSAPVDDESADARHSGMTVNERLVSAGLMQEFEEAARRKDRAAMVDTLVRSGFPEASAVQTTDAILANPQRYGY